MRQFGQSYQGLVGDEDLGPGFAGCKVITACPVPEYNFTKAVECRSVDVLLKQGLAVEYEDLHVLIFRFVIAPVFHSPEPCHR